MTADTIPLPEQCAWYVRFDSGRVDLLAIPVSDRRRAMWESAGKRFTVTPMHTADQLRERDAWWQARLREAVEAEREANAALCCSFVDAEYATGKVDHNENAWTAHCAAAIRARSQA